MSEIQIQTTGHLTADPEIRFTPSGQSVCTFRVAVTPRRKQGEQWIDGEPTFLGCEAWGTLGEHVAESLERGAQVFVSGVLRTQRWKDNQTGQDRERLFVRVDEIGPSLRFATARPAKAQRQTPHPAGQAAPIDPFSGVPGHDTGAHQQAVQAVRQGLGGQPVGDEAPPF